MYNCMYNNCMYLLFIIVFIYYTWNDNLAATFEAKLKVAVDDQEPQSHPFHDVFNPTIAKYPPNVRVKGALCQD